MKKNHKQSSPFMEHSENPSEKLTDVSVISPEASGRWRQFIARIKNTEIYQIFFIRAQQNSFSKGLTFLFIICTMLGHLMLTTVLNPPLEFNELKITHGTFDHFGYVGRKNALIFRNEEGTTDGFRTKSLDPATEQNLASLKGEFMTIYYRHEFNIFFIPYRFAEAISYKDKYIIEYTRAQYNWQLMFYNGAKKIFFLCVVLGFMSLFIVYLRHHKNE